MANFDIAFDITMGNEGAYSNNPLDAGAETVFGISRKFNPTWNGWKYVDAAKKQPNFPASLKSNAPLLAEAKTFYKGIYWNIFSLDSMLDQKSANEIFDTAINQGEETEANGLQLAVWLLGNDIELDGKVGPATIAAADKCDDKKLLQTLNLIQGKRYIEICIKNPSQRAFFKGGWIDRTML